MCAATLFLSPVRAQPPAANANSGNTSATGSAALTRELDDALKRSGIARIAVQGAGTRVTLRTFAEERLSAITGKPVYDRFDPANRRPISFNAATNRERGYQYSIDPQPFPRMKCEREI